MKTTAQVVTLVSIFTLALACSSSTTPTPTGAAGHAGAGTAGAGTAGAGTAGAGTAGAGTAGAGTAGAGTAGAGTAGAGTAGATACAAPTAPAIDDFSGMGGLVGGMPYTSGDPGGANAPTASIATGSLVITYNGGTTTNMYPYEAVGVGLNACTDASAYTGVTFMISGTLSAGCTIQFSAVDREHNMTPNGTCTTGCYPGGAMFTLPATPTAVMIEFAAQGAGGTDVPGAAPVDPTQLVAIQWQANPPAMMGCTGT